MVNKTDHITSKVQADDINREILSLIAHYSVSQSALPTTGQKLDSVVRFSKVLTLSKVDLSTVDLKAAMVLNTALLCQPMETHDLIWLMGKLDEEVRELQDEVVDVVSEPAGSFDVVAAHVVVRMMLEFFDVVNTLLLVVSGLCECVDIEFIENDARGQRFVDGLKDVTMALDAAFIVIRNLVKPSGKTLSELMVLSFTAWVDKQLGRNRIMGKSGHVFIVTQSLFEVLEKSNAAKEESFDPSDLFAIALTFNFLYVRDRPDDMDFTPQQAHSMAMGLMARHFLTARMYSDFSIADRLLSEWAKLSTHKLS